MLTLKKRSFFYGFVGSTVFKAITEGARKLAIPSDEHHPIYTSAKGLGNIASGVSQCVVGVFF